MRSLIAMILLACSQSLSAQTAVWNGKSYSSRVCSNPNCGMCASIQQQIESQRVQSQSPTFWKQVREPVQLGGGIDDGYELYRTETTMEARTRQVKRCNGKQCWYETVTEMVPVTRQVPVSQQQPTQQAAPKPKANTLTNTELVPTPQVVVDAMIESLGLTASSKFFDLGCGDGRLLITAAQRYACYSVGVELNPKTVALARKRASNEFVSTLVMVFQGDVRAFDLTEADSVSMYLYPDLMAELVPKLKPGAKIVSYLHEIPGIKQESVSISHDGQTHIFFVGVK